MNNSLISVVYHGMLQRTLLMRLGMCSALFSLLCAPLCAIAQNTTWHSGSESDMPDVVRQAYVNPRAITLPVVDGKGIRFTRLSTEEGLSQTKVSQIVQDDQGFMWFGTQYGLDRYDGYKFRVFKHVAGVTNSLGGVYIYSLFKDRFGSLWIGCDELLDKFDPVTETFTHYRIGTPDAAGETAPITHIREDSTGKLWLATSRGLYRFDPSTGQSVNYQHDPNDPFSLSSSDIKSTGEDREGTFWIATSEGVDAFDQEKGKITLHIPLRERGEMSFYEDSSGLLWIVHVTGDGLAVYDRKTNLLTSFSFHKGHISKALPTGAMAILEDRDGNLWIGTMGDGLLKFDRPNQKFIRYWNDPLNPESLVENAVHILFQDREGNIWAGPNMMAPSRFSTRPPPFEIFKREPGNPNSLSGTMVNGIYQDRQETLWMSAMNALNRIDRKTGHYSFYLTAQPGLYSEPLAITEDQSGLLWVGSDGHGLIRLNPQTGQLKTFKHDSTDRSSLSNDIVTRVLIDHAGTLWAATFDGVDRFGAATSRFKVYKFDKQNTAQIYIEIKEDHQGALWLGTHYSGLQRFDPITGRFTAIYRHSANDPTSLSNDRVNSVHFDHLGTMWVGTQKGLDKFDSRTGKFTNYYEQDGLPGDAVSCILEDERGNLWMSTNNGLSVFDPLKQSFKNYSAGDGLPGADLTGWNTCYKSPSGEMFFGGFSGGVAFYPDKVVDRPFVPPVVLTDFQLFGRTVTVGSRSPLRKSIGYTNALRLSHGQNILSLEFSALSYFSSATNRYRYRLDGLDHQWHEVSSNQRLVSYTTLPTGRYTFHVQGATSRGAWSEPGLKLTIEILPPWWATWWFRTLCFAVCGVLLVGFYRWRIEQLRREEKHLREVVETIPAMAFTAGPDGSREFVNRRWLDFAGLTDKAILASDRELTVHPDDLEEHLTKWRASLATGVPFENEARHCNAHGAYRWFLVRAVPLHDRQGTILKWYGTLTDIEDRKRAEERLQELRTNVSQSSSASMGAEISASIAHEINQPLTSVLANAQACARWLRVAPPNIEAAVTSAGRIVRDVRAADAVMHNVRSLFKKQPVVRAPCNMVDLIQDIMSLIKEDVNRRSTPIECDYQEPVLVVLVDRFQIQQIVMNLIRNAIEAMEDSDRSPLLRICIRPTTERQVLTEFIDNGCGLPIHDADKIFDSFVTTKKNGMGIGLAISRSIVEAHDGRLWAENNADFGAKFSLLLRSTKAT